MSLIKSTIKNKKLRQFIDKNRLGILNFSLGVIYFLILTPIAIFVRSNKESPVYGWKKDENPGWQEQKQSTLQKEIFRSML